MTIVERESFRVFTDVLEQTSKAKGSEAKLKIIEDFWKQISRVSSSNADDCPSRMMEPSDSFSVLRLLLPELDDERRSFGMKEKGLAELYISVLELDSQSFDAQRLRRWQDPNLQQQAGEIPARLGSFFSVLEAVLRHRCSDTSCLTIAQVNDSLNELNTVLEKEKRKKIFHRLVSNCTLTENIWISRIILKEMHLGIRFEHILKWFHPSALEDYRLTHSLRRICEDCFQPGFHITSQDIILGQPASVSLAKRQENLQRIPYLMPDGFYLEPKFDGERLQLHKKGDEIQCFSRNALDTTNLYGPHLKSAILLCVDAQDCVLDGEVLLYNVEKQSFEHFDQIRHYVSKDIELGENFFITFMIFDVLYVDQNQNAPPSIISFPLETRKEILKGIVRPFHSQIRLVPYREGRTVEDIKDAMEDFVQQKYEGVVIKNKKKPYVLGERDDEVMIKLKPDYFTGFIHDLDVLILGAFIGTGYSKQIRLGKPSHFLIGLLEKDYDESHDRLSDVNWIVIGKVGSGYSYEQLECLQDKLAPFWKPFDKKSPPEHLKNSLLKADAVPDYWIEPCHSVVLTIHAYEVRPSSIYSGYAVRFPRVASIRWDKKWYECSTLEELIVSQETSSVGSSVETLTGNKKRKTQSGRLERRVDLPQVETLPDASSFTGSKILDGVVTCVIGASSNQEKQYYEKLVECLGGKTVQSVTPDTSFVLAVSPNHVAVTNMVSSFQNPRPSLKRNLRSRGCLEPKNILKVSWLLECQSKNRLLDILPYHVIWATDTLKEDMQRRCDCWGDSWTQAVDENSLLQLLENMSVPDDDLSMDVSTMVENCPELKEIDYGGLFRGWRIVVKDFKHFCDTDAAAFLAAFYGCQLVVDQVEVGNDHSFLYYLISDDDNDNNNNHMERNRDLSSPYSNSNMLTPSTIWKMVQQHRQSLKE